MNDYFVYALCDPRKPGNFKYDDLIFTFEPFYIGKGHGNRPQQHWFSSAERKYNKIKSNKISSIKTAGLVPIVVKVMEGLEQDRAFMMETACIIKIGAIFNKYISTIGPLSNVLLNARPPNNKGRKHTRQTINKRMATFKARNCRAGYKHSAETKMKLCHKGSLNPMFGKHHSQITINKIKNNRIMPTGASHYASRPILAIDPTGAVHQFASLTNTAIMLDCCLSTLSKCLLRDGRPTRGKVGGWYFRYAD